MENISGLLFILAIAVVCFIISFIQHKEKGFLFNQVFVYISKEDRQDLDPKPYYKQSSIIFLLIGIGFIFLGLEVFLQSGWLLYIFFGDIVLLLCYIIISTSLIRKKK